MPRRTVLLLVGAIALAAHFVAGWLSDASGLGVEEVLARATRIGEGVADLRCTARVEMTFGRWPPITLSVEYLVKPPHRARLTITSREAQERGHDEFEYKQGMICVIRDGELYIWNPSNLRLMETDLTERGAIDATFVHHGTGRIPGVAPYVQGMHYVSRLENFEARLTGTEQVRGRRAYLVELAPKQAAKTFEPWDIASQRIWIDAERFVPLKSEVADPNGKLVSTTTYGDIREVRQGLWAALKAETTVRPGSVRVTQPIRVRRGGQPPKRETWKGDVPYGGRIIRREFQWFDDKVLLPKTVEVTDLDGKMLSRAVFEDYQLNTGIPDSEFDLFSAGP